jgi:hypothetical protein
MRRLLILSVALIVLLAVAVPVGAAKGGSFKSSPLEVTVDTDHFWANAPGDVIVWSVFATNKGRSPLEPVTACEFDLDSDTCTGSLQLAPGDVNADGSLDPGETWVYEYRYTVTAADLGLDTVTRVVKVTAVDGTENPARSYTVISTLSVDTKWLDRCDFVGDTLTYDETNPADAMGPCYYGFEKGYWKLTLMPEHAGKKPLSLSMTMRDGVPGNWCQIPDGSEGFLEGSGVASTQWRAGDPPLELYVYFPANGECLRGGAGGETIAVNNPNIFFLAAWGFSEGTVTATKCESLTIQKGTITGCNP